MPRSLVLFLVLGAAALPPPPLEAQVNIERFRRADRDTGWTAVSTVDLSLRAGNEDLVLVGLSGRIDHVGAATRSLVLVSGDLGWQRGRRFSNSGVLHLRRTFLTPRAVHPEAFVQIDYDRARALAFRALVGTGPRVELVQGGGARLALGTAYMLEHERLDLPATALHPRRTTHHRWSSYLATSFGSGERLAAGLTAYVQPRLGDFGDVRLLADGSVAARAGGPASLALTLALRYDTRPPDGTRSLDATLKSGVAIEW
jgi:hypothetical protein